MERSTIEEIKRTVAKLVRGCESSLASRLDYSDAQSNSIPGR